METTKEGLGEVQILLTAVNKHSNTDDSSPQFIHSTYRLPNGASCGQDVIHNKDTFARRNFKIPSKHSYAALFFSEDAPRS